jgi:hypothetical protein
MNEIIVCALKVCEGTDVILSSLGGGQESRARQGSGCCGESSEGKAQELWSLLSPGDRQAPCQDLTPRAEREAMAEVGRTSHGVRVELTVALGLEWTHSLCPEDPTGFLPHRVRVEGTSGVLTAARISPGCFQPGSF